MTSEERKSYNVGFVSLGCAKNLCDTEVMLSRLVNAGYGITPEETEADVVIINTCAFIESAKKESIESILDIAWLKENRDLKGIVVCGCLAERYGEEVLNEMPEVDAVVGVGRLTDIEAAVDSVLEKASKKDKKSGKYYSVGDKESCPLGGDRVITTGEGFAYLKIAEGCNNRCSYCVIPHIRGNLRSRSADDIVDEAKDLESQGIKEIVLIAQDTSVWGYDFYGVPSLDKLLTILLNETKSVRYRILYCYPDKITDALLDVMASNDRIINYLDLPIQHISDNILTAMNRHGDSALIRETVRKAREKVPGIVLRTTAIVGFPGETEEDFAELCSFIKEAKFERFGAFTYSPEEGTPAAEMEGQIDEQVKQDRYDIIMKTQQPISEKTQLAQIGKTLSVLCEGFDEVSECYLGRSDREAPESDGKIWFTSNKPVNEGAVVSVKITEAMDYDLVGEALIL